MGACHHSSFILNMLEGNGRTTVIINEDEHRRDSCAETLTKIDLEAHHDVLSFPPLFESSRVVPCNNTRYQCRATPLVQYRLLLVLYSASENRHNVGSRESS